ncbi:MAG: hypothetical protein CMP39_07490 [Rickettsiales bacterium]|nr:hypothetical protein [Rickettsiales bacterium]|tara:strand:+ start:2655 stop:3251 length:597 start_codon:yes stop_codon:yes gene_type:complete
MIIFGIFLLCFIIGGIPIEDVLTPKIKEKDSQSSKIQLEPSPFATYFILTCLVQFAVGYGLTILAREVLYFSNDSFLIAALLVLVTSHCWPIFNGFKQNKYPLLLITGISSAFYTNFFWIIPIIYLIFTILLNSQFISYLTTLLSLLILYSFIENIPDNFLFLNLGIFIIFILLYSNNIFNSLEGKSNTLYRQFQKRP